MHIFPPCTQITGFLLVLGAALYPVVVVPTLTAQQVEVHWLQSISIIAITTHVLHHPPAGIQPRGCTS